MNNKKALASGLYFMILVLFLFGVMSLFSSVMWNYYNDSIQGMDNETIDPTVKAEINDLGIWFTWGDYIFMLLFIAMLVSYFISAITIPAQHPIYFLIFTVYIIMVTIFAMLLSNSWEYILSLEVFTRVINDFTWTNFFMNYYPFFTFFIGLFASILFFTKTYLKRGVQQSGDIIAP